MERNEKLVGSSHCLAGRDGDHGALHSFPDLVFQRHVCRICGTRL